MTANGPHNYSPALHKRRHVPKPLESLALEQDADGNWTLTINGGTPLPASDVEVQLWLENQELKNELAAYKN